MVGVEEREFRHGNDEHVRQKLEAERAQFKSNREVGDVQHTTTETPTVAGEPRTVGSSVGDRGNYTLGGPGAAGTTSLTDGDITDGVSGARGTATTGTNGAGLGKGMSQGNTFLSGSGLNSAGATGEGSTTRSLKDRMNPNIDADGDGKLCSCPR